MIKRMRLLRRTLWICGGLTLFLVVGLGLFFFGKQVVLMTSDFVAEADRLESELSVAKRQVEHCRIDVARDEAELASMYDALVQRGVDGGQTFRSLLSRHIAIQADCTRKTDRLTELVRDLGVVKVKRARAGK